MSDRGEPGDKPLDPEVERVRRKILRFFVVSIGVTFIAVMAVVGLVVYKLERTSTPAQPQAIAEIPGRPLPEAAATLALDAGTKILSQSLSGDRLSLDTLAADGGHVIIIYDLAEQRVASRLKIVTAGQ